MPNNARRLRLATALLFAASSVLPLVAQAPSSGPSSTVVYVGGDDLVLKSSDGKLLNYTVPSGVKFSVASGKVSLSELKPGTKITAPVSTGFDPQIVSSISVVKGKVYAVTPPDGVTLTLSEGIKELAVPAGTTFMVDGKPLKVSELKPDMMVEATIVTTANADAASATGDPAAGGHAAGGEGRFGRRHAVCRHESAADRTCGRDDADDGTLAAEVWPEAGSPGLTFVLVMTQKWQTTRLPLDLRSLRGIARDLAAARRMLHRAVGHDEDSGVTRFVASCRLNHWRA